MIYYILNSQRIERRDKNKKMKLHYDSPIADVLPIADEDIITTSDGRNYQGDWDTDW